MTLIKALIFDVDGTLAETEELHREAFNQTFLDMKLNWHWNQVTYGHLLKVTGGRERMEHFANTQGMQAPDCAALHKIKTKHYNDMIHGNSIKLRPGVEKLLREARNAGMTLAIATTTSRLNVKSLIETTLGTECMSWFSAICCGEDVLLKKPDAQVYKLALELLSIKATEAIAFEDSENGLKAALGAQLPCIITPSIYTANDDFTGAILKLPDLSQFKLDDISPGATNRD